MPLTALLALSLAILCTASTALAADAPEDAKSKALGPLAGKLDARLIPGVEAVRAGKSSDADAARDVKEKLGSIAKTSQADQFPVRIDAAVDDALLTKIKATGATVLSSAAHWNTVTAEATLTQIDALTRIDGVLTITLERGPRLKDGK